MTQVKRISTTFYLVLLISLILLSYAFSKSKGLLYDIDKMGNLLYTNDLFSSGSDDNLCIEIGALIFCIPLIFKLLRFKRDIKISDSIVFLIAWSVQLIFLLAIEAGSIVKTIYYSYNLALTLWIVLFIILIVFCLIYLFRAFKVGKIRARAQGK